MIRIKPSPTADTRSCDYKNVSKQQLHVSSAEHIFDARRALDFFIKKIREAGSRHDADKLWDIDSFHFDFLTGFKRHEWWDLCVDAITGEGLALAFHQALALVDAIVADDPAMYAAAHRRIVQLPVRLMRLLLTVERRPALRRRLMLALAHDPALFERILAVHVRALPARRLGVQPVLRAAWRLLGARREARDQGQVTKNRGRQGGSPLGR